MLDRGAVPRASTKSTLQENKVDWITADLVEVLHNMSWFDGIAYILLGLGIYAAYRWIKKKIQCIFEGGELGSTGGKQGIGVARLVA